MAAYKLGKDAELYYGVAGSTAGTLLAEVFDVTLNVDKSEADVTTRASAGWRSTRTALREGSIDFSIKAKTSDAGLAAIRTAFQGDTLLAFKCIDASGGSGIDADFSITKYSEKQALEEAVTIDVSIKICTENRTPSWI